jgi:hypothetical protein
MARSKRQLRIILSTANKAILIYILGDKKMKKMTFILMIMAACLASVAFADAPADITNPSFEEDTAGICDAWTESADNYDGISYITGDAANANFGDDYYQVQNVGSWGVIHTALGEEVAVTAGSNYDMVLWARTATEATGTVGLKFEFYATSGEGWVEGSTPFSEEIVDITGDYQQFTLTATIPAGMAFARATVVGQAVAAFVDDVWVGPEGTYPGLAGPFAPDPGNNVIVSRTAPTTDLNWSIPDGDIGNTVTIEFEEEDPLDLDPNFPNTVSPAVSTGSGTGLETIALSSLSPALTLPLDDGLYSWRVKSGPNPEDQGKVWYFSIGDALPVPGQPVNQFMWVQQDDSGIPGGDGPSDTRYFEVTASYTDDGESAIADANFLNLNFGWDPANGETGVEQVSLNHDAPSKTVTAVYKTVALGEDLSNPTFETGIPGWWNIQLQVKDGNGEYVQGVAGYHRIDATCGDMANANEADTFDTTYDVNLDCINDVIDLEAFAAAWLAQSPKFE